MLLHLEIHNFALIDNIGFELGEGLNILTGETGAGKSVIIDSINAVLGERLSRDLIRTGADKAFVEAVFQVESGKLGDILEENGVPSEEDGTVIISREFSINSKNICRVNGKLVTTSVLKAIGERIIDLHGQHDNQSLLRTESHIELLDLFGGEKIHALKQKFAKLLEEYKIIRNKLSELSGDRNERERKIDMLKFQIDEIRKSKLKLNEEDELNKQRIILTNSEKIAAALSNAYEYLFSGKIPGHSITDDLNRISSEINSLVRFDNKYSDLSKSIEEISYRLEDITGIIRSERDSVELSPELLDHISERLDLIYKLKRKYGNSIEEIIKYMRKCENELDELVKSEEIVSTLRSKLELKNSELYQAALELNTNRREACGILENKISSELNDLEMKKSQFKVDIQFNGKTDGNDDLKYTQNGLNVVEFLISPNIGEPLKPLSKIVSGGEMSRVMLAIKTILADVDKIPTLIFDEIDMGISGKAARKVGEKLAFISAKHQVICVTHLTQIACLSDNHFLIEKISDNDKTKTIVKKLGYLEKRNEIARLLDGAGVTDITIRHAEEIMKNADQAKLAIFNKHQL